MLKDPMAKRMIARAEKLGVAGKYVSLMKEMVKAAQKLSKEPVDIDLLGATAAVMFDIGFTPEATWGILSVTRAFATGAHYCEEIEREEPVRLGQTLTPKEWYDGPEDRPVPTLEERKKVAKADGGPDARGVETDLPRTAEDQGVRLGYRRGDRRPQTEDLIGGFLPPLVS